MKKLFLLFSLFLFSGATNVFAQETAYRLSTHILDISRGIPAQNVQVDLFKNQAQNDEWQLLKSEKTDKNGRIANFVPADGNENGIYKLRFHTTPYFQSQNLKSVYPYIEVVFEISGTGHYHIPITVSANGYSTYRGN